MCTHAHTQIHIYMHNLKKPDPKQNKKTTYFQKQQKRSSIHHRLSVTPYLSDAAQSRGEGQEVEFDPASKGQDEGA